MVLAALATAIGAYLVVRALARPPTSRAPSAAAVARRAAQPLRELAGIPVSTLGTLGGIALFAATFLRPPNGPPVTFGIAVAGALFSGYLTVLEGFVIDAWCAWCLASAALWACAAVVAGVRAARVPAAT